MNRLTGSVISVSFVIGLALTGWGLSRTSIPLVFPTRWDQLPGYWVFLAYCLPIPILALAGRFIPAGFAGVAMILAGLIGVAVGGVWPMLVVTWFAVAAILLGRAVLSVIGVEGQQRGLAAEFLVGAGLYGSLVGLIAHFSVNYPGVYGIALAVPLAANWRGAIRLGEDFAHWLRTHRTTSWLEFFIAAVVLLHFTVAFMPEVGHDALAMHLFVPAHLAWRHEWSFDVSTYIWAVMPMLGDWIYSIGYMLAGESAARLLNVGFVLVLSWFIWDMVTWAGGSRMGARWAVLIFLTTPLTFTETSSLFVESIWSAYIAAGTLLIMRTIMSTDENPHQLRTAGLLLGFAIATKAISFLFLPGILLLFLLTYRQWWEQRFAKSILVGIGMLITIGLIPYATAWGLTGNPVFPFFNKIFQSSHYPIVNFDSSSIFSRGLTWDVLYNVTFSSEKYIEGRPGAPGFQWLLLFIPTFIGLLILVHKKALALIFVAIVSIALVFMSVSYLRYIFPAFALVAAGIGIGMSGFLSGNRVVRVLASGVACLTVGLNLTFFTAGTYYGNLEMEPLLSASGRKAYIENRLPIREAVALVNTINIGQAPVAVFSQPLVAGLAANALYPNWYNWKFQELVTHAGSPAQIADVLVGYGVGYVILDDQWSDRTDQEMVKGATEEVSNIRHINVRRLRPEYRFQSELLANPGLRGNEDWIWSSGQPERVTDGVAVSVKQLGYQVVPVSPSVLYRNAVTARCENSPTQGRLQVNWLDADQRFIKSAIEVFECSAEWAQHSTEFTSPRNAAYAVVYATGHTQTPLIFNEVSFRR